MSVFKDGVLVDVDVSFWSGAKALKSEDLGLDPKTLPEAYKLGKKFLVPAGVIKAFRSIENKARRAVETGSFKFPIGNARFVPKRKFKAVLEELRQCRAEYLAKVDDLVENYDKYRSEMRRVYVEAADTAWLMSAPTGVVEFGIDQREAEKAEYVAAFLKRIDSFYPAPETLRARYDLSWDLFEVAMPAMRKTGSDALVEREDMLAEAEKTYRETYRCKMAGFVDDVVATLRKETVEICGRIASNIKDGKVVTGRSLKSLKDFIAKFSELNFVGDSRIEDQLETLRKEFLDAHTTESITAEVDLQEDLRRRLHELTEAAGDVTDINSVTGEYRRRVSWDQDGDRTPTTE